MIYPATCNTLSCRIVTLAEVYVVKERCLPRLHQLQRDCMVQTLQHPSCRCIIDTCVLWQSYVGMSIQCSIDVMLNAPQ